MCDRPDVKYVFAGCGYNRIMKARFTASATDAIVGCIVSRLDALGIEALWFVTPATTTGLSSIIEQHGFVPRSEWISMAMDLTKFPTGNEVPSGLKICEAHDSKDLDAWAKVMIVSYGLDDEVHQVYGRYLITQGNSDSFRRSHFLGLLDDMPVATTMVFKGKEAAGIYWVGTLPEARRHGIASTMVRHALLEAKKCGYKIAILNASAEGHPIYQKIGFTDYYTTSIYHRKSH